MQEYSMIRDGDRVLLCLSGGKDSLSLLHVLHQYQFYCRSQVSVCDTAVSVRSVCVSLLWQSGQCVTVVAIRSVCDSCGSQVSV